MRARLVERFEAEQSTSPRRRLTRELSAEWMQISIRTHDKIFKRQLVDRSTLVTVFTALDLPWSEDYCQDQERFSLNESSDTATAPMAEYSRSSSGGTRRLVFRVVGVAAAAIVFGLVGSPPRSPVDPDKWYPQFKQQMTKATLAYHAGDYRAAEETLAAAGTIASSWRDAGAMAWHKRMESEVLAAQGRAAEAHDKIQDALSLQTELGLTSDYFSALEIAANLRVKLGSLDQAHRDYERCLQFAQTQNRCHDEVAALRGIGVVASERGSYARAIACFDQALKRLQDSYEPGFAYNLKALRAVAVARSGRFEESLKTLEECLNYWTRKGHRRWMATTAYQVASVLKLNNDARTARQYYAYAKQLYVQSGDHDGSRRSEVELQGL